MTVATLARDTTFTVAAKPFASAVAWAAKHLPRTNNIPALCGMLLDARGGRLHVSAFDWDVAATATVPVDDDVQGRWLVGGRLLEAVAKTLPDKPVTVEANGSKLTVHCGAMRLTLPLMPVGDYPTLPAMPPPVGTVDAETLADAVARTAPFAFGVGDVAMLMAVLFAFDGGRIELRATDRYRAGAAPIGWNPSGSAAVPSALVPGAVLEKVASLLAADGGQVTVSVADGLVGLASASRSVVARQVAGQYPAVETLFPKPVDTPAVVSVADLSEVVKRAALVLEPKAAVRLVFATDVLTVVADGANDAGIDDEVACTYAGPELTIGFNPRYLVDALHACGTAEVAIHVSHPRRPALFLPHGSESGYRHLVVPVRIN